jgi:pimeloyl-ACP methyl ester carboxylesterase
MPYFTSNQRRLFYRECGQDRGPLLLILHGNTASSAHHSAELDYFGQRYHVVALDFLGCGQSERLAVWPADWWAQGGRDAAALVRHLGEERALVMGTSGGGVAALWMAIQHPERVRAVIADSCAECKDAAVVEAQLRERHRFTAGQVDFWQRGHGEDWEQVVNADSDLLRRFVAAGGDWFGGRLAEVQCPLLLTASLRDDMVERVDEQICSMALQVRGSRVFFNSAGGHPFMWSQPADFRRVADCFLSSLEK